MAMAVGVRLDRLRGGGATGERLFRLTFRGQTEREWMRDFGQIKSKQRKVRGKREYKREWKSVRVFGLDTAYQGTYGNSLGAHVFIRTV